LNIREYIQIAGIYRVKKVTLRYIFTNQTFYYIKNSLSQHFMLLKGLVFLHKIKLLRILHIPICH